MDPSDLEELRQHASRVCDGDITAEQRAALERLLEQSSEARRQYLAFLRLHAALNWRYRTGPSQPSNAGEQADETDRGCDAPSAAPVQLASSARGAATGRKWTYGALLLSVAGSLLAIAYVARQGEETELPKPSATGESTVVPTFVATLRDATHVVWRDADVPVETGARVATGQLLLEAGEAELVFDSGARLVVAGPARLHLDSPLAARLDYGKAAAFMPESAVGFTLTTPTSTLVDQGTEFGVLAEPDKATEVHVFRGQVDLLYSQSDEPKNSRTLALSSRQARRIENADGIGREIEFSKSRFGDLALRVAEPVAWPVQEGGNGHYYQLVVHDKPLSWHEAARLAMNKHFRGMPGHLVTSTSAEEDRFIVDRLLADFSYRGVWMGLTDVLREGHFQWITDEPYDFQNWASQPAKQPDNFHEAPWHGGEDYGMYTRFPGPSWQWNDLSIDSIHERVSAYVVEYEPAIDALRHRSMEFPPTQWRREDGGNGHFYQLVLVLEPTPWDVIRDRAAEHRLAGAPGHLATLETSAERDFLVDQILRICGIPELMIGLQGSLLDDRLEWIDGQPVEQVRVRLPNFPADKVYGVFRWDALEDWQVQAMAWDVLPAEWFGYVVEYPARETPSE